MSVFLVRLNRVKYHSENSLFLIMRSGVKNLVYVDFYEIHQDHVDRAIVNSKSNYYDPNSEDYITGGLI